jgi:hypothetical protein
MEILCEQGEEQNIWTYEGLAQRLLVSQEGIRSEKLAKSMEPWRDFADALRLSQCPSYQSKLIVLLMNVAGWETLGGNIG